MKSYIIGNTTIYPLKLNESDTFKNKKEYFLEGIFADLSGKENRNGRIYTPEEYLPHLEYLRKDILSGDGLLGELDHPEDRFEINLKEVSHQIVDVWYDPNKKQVLGKIKLLDTPNGKIAKSLVDDGVPLHISSRSAGNVDPNNHKVNIQQMFTFDLVAKPGFAEAILHRVNESENTKKYSDNTIKFLNNTIRANSMNAAPQFGILNENISINGNYSNISLREEAIKTKINNKISLNEMCKPLLEEDKKDIEKEKLILSVNPVYNKEEKMILKIEAIYKDEKENFDSENKDGFDETKDSNESDELSNTLDPETDALNDKLTNAKDKLDSTYNVLGKVDTFLSGIKKKNEAKESTIEKYPFSAALTESEFAKFNNLDWEQKEKVAKYINENCIIDTNSINSLWEKALISKPEEPIWLTKASEKYRKLYESASQKEKDNLNYIANFMVFESQMDIDTFWEKSGLKDEEEKKILNEKFLNSIPIFNKINESEELPYSKDFIESVGRHLENLNSK